MNRMCKLQYWQDSGLIRQRHVIAKNNPITNEICLENKTYLNFSTNDYLGLSQHPEIIEAGKRALSKYGLGSGASAMVSGYYDCHQMLETAFSEWLGVEKAILFSSGYLANLGVFRALLHRHDTVISDRECHSSLLDGIQLSHAKHYRYCSIEDLHAKLSHIKVDAIVTESVFSMSGRIAPLDIIARLSQKNNTKIFIDDAHGIGFLGKTGGGICEDQKYISKENCCISMPLGKSFNAIGAIVAGDKKTMEAILQFSKTYCYNTALPPMICCTLLTTLNIIQTQHWRRNKLLENILYFNQICARLELPLVSEAITPIKSILIGDVNKLNHIQQYLLQKRFYLGAIREPSVPKNGTLFRISLNCHHTKSQIKSLLKTMKEML